MKNLYKKIPQTAFAWVSITCCTAIIVLCFFSGIWPRVLKVLLLAVQLFFVCLHHYGFKKGWDLDEK